MSRINAFAAVRLDGALEKIDDALAMLGLYPDSRLPREVLLGAKGDLTAMRQLLEMEADLAAADTERAMHLRVVK
jgi:hypothetical protein